MAWINEFHYDDASTDQGEFVEIAGVAGTDLTGWKIVLYNGSNGATYGERLLNGTIADQQNGFGTVSFGYPVNGLQNGAPDGLALVDPTGAVVQFLSYEGVITATNGPAAGMTSIDVGVSEPGNAEGTSIGLTGSGDEAGDFIWTLNSDDTPGGANNGQSFGAAPPPPTPGAFSIADASAAEGDSGTGPITFTVTRGSDSNVAASVSYSVTLPGGTGGASADDVSGVLSGTIDFAADEFSKTITLDVAGDRSVEGDETFTVTLSNPTAGATLADNSATGTITETTRRRPRRRTTCSSTKSTTTMAAPTPARRLRSPRPQAPTSPAGSWCSTAQPVALPSPTRTTLRRCPASFRARIMALAPCPSPIRPMASRTGRRTASRWSTRRARWCSSCPGKASSSAAAVPRRGSPARTSACRNSAARRSDRRCN